MLFIYTVLIGIIYSFYPNLGCFSNEKCWFKVSIEINKKTGAILQKKCPSSFNRFTGKHLLPEPLFNYIAGLQPEALLKNIL